MGSAYPELTTSLPQIEKILLQEEEQFAKTLDKGMRVLEQDVKSLSGAVIPGKTVFTLYDTYGFPVDLTNDIARERGLSLDYDGFEEAMEAQRERARAASKFGVDYNEGLSFEGATEFLGYDHVTLKSKVSDVVVQGESRVAKTGDEIIVLLDATPFYAESGGQVGDTGELVWDSGLAKITDTKKDGEQFLHIGVVSEGELQAGQQIEARVNRVARNATALNHSATHLLHAALRKILGDHVTQKGSLVNADRLRFDFAHFEALSDSEIDQIEVMVNQQIRANTPVITTLTDMNSAKEMGAMALFGEKYGEQVRVLAMGEDGFSVELCGGTHVQRTGDIGSCIVISEGGISSGVRRIEAITGEAADVWVREMRRQGAELASLLKCNRDEVVDKARLQSDRLRSQEKELQQLKAKLASSAGTDLAGGAVDVQGIKVVSAALEGVDRKSLMETADKLKNQLGDAVVLLASEGDGKVIMIASVTKSISSRFPAGDLMRDVSAVVGGKGGGRPDMAQGGGSDPDKLQDALKKVIFWVESKL